MKIAERLTLVLLIMSLVMLSVTGVVSYTIAKRALTRQVLDQLQSIATIQKSRLLAIVERRLDMLALISNRTQLRLNFESYIRDPKIGLQDVMNRMLQDSRESIRGIRKISMLTLDGKVAASTDPAEIGREFADQACFLRGQANNSVNDPHLDDDGNLALHVSGPLRLNDTLLGVIVIDDDAQDIVSLATDYTGLGKTGETLLGRLGADGNGVFLTPLRFDKHAALRRRVSKEDLESPAMQALLKHQGLFLEAVDYRGKPVLAATRYIEETGWGLAVKIDASEAFEPVTRLRTVLMLVFLIALALAIYVSVHLARSITRPIAKLTEAAARIAKGDLEARVKPTSKDEIGSLGQAFDQMAQALKTDIARRERAEARAEHLNAVLRGIRNVNQLIVSDPDRDVLIQGACNNLTSTFGYAIAGIVLLDESGKLISSAWAGVGEEFSSLQEELGRGKIPPCGSKAIGQPDVVVIDNVETKCLGCPLVSRTCPRGHMAVRLEYQSKLYGFLCVVMDVSFVGDAEDRVLFREVAKDIAFALRKIEQRAEHERLEEELRASEQQLEAIATSAQDGIIMTDNDGNVSYWNDAAERIFGYARDEILGKNLHRTLAPKEYHEAYEKGFNSFRNSGQGPAVGKTLELSALKKDGTRFPVELSLSSVRLHGEWCAVGIVRDITERKRAEEALRASERKYRTLVENLPQKIFIKDRESVYVSCNENYASDLRIRADEIPGKTDYDFFPRELADKYRGDDARIMAGGKLEALDERYLRDGEERFVHTVKTPLRDDKGEVIGIMGVFWDITERKQAEEALKESEARYKALFEASADGILITDVKTQELKYANPAICRMLGYCEAELTRMTIADIHPKNALEHVVSEFQAFARGEIALAESIPCLRRDGTQIQADISGAVCEINGRKCNVGFFRDITERKMLQNQLAQAQKLEAIGGLAAGIAHEINTPTQYVGDNISFMGDASTDLWRLLSEYGNLLDAAKEGSVSNELVSRVSALAEEVDVAYLNKEMRAATDQAKEGVERISSIVRAMRQFAHPGAEEKVATDVNGAIENTITVSRNEWKYVADMETDLDLNLPLVQLLPGEFNQVILNMIVNSAHSIANVVGDGSNGKGKITIKTRRDGELAEIRVSDTGTGVPEKLRDRVFDPFFTTKGVGKGTGQGLAIAHSVIVDKHHGTIGLESEEGKGATFIIRLPIGCCDSLKGQDNDGGRQ